MHRNDLDPWRAGRLMRPAPNRALRTFLGAILVLLAALVIAAPQLAAPGDQLAVAVPLGLFAVLASVAARGFRLRYPFDRMGSCNFVTLTRGALAVLLAVPIMSGGMMAAAGYAWGIFVLGAVCLLLDGLDGILARRSGLVSEFGARFDVEVDAVFAALLAILALQSGKAGAVVLLLGFLRYGFVAAGAVLPWLARPLPDSSRRKTICVIVMGVLIALTAPPVQPPLSVWLAGAAALLLVGSFAADIRTLWRRRR